ncbi:MAG: hypothetical protein LBQ97_04125 [Fusobacteriaceae bacterium]|jgi:hypothetical protein|nr:hypothetical protein [Fusobacteriaceae bacterium]
MKKMIFTALFLSFLLFGSSTKWEDLPPDNMDYHNETRDGISYTAFTYLKAKKPYQSLFYENIGKKTDTKTVKMAEIYYESGQLRIFIDYRNPEKITYREYYENGQLGAEIVNDQDMKKKLSAKYYNQKGKPIKEAEFNKLTGKPGNAKPNSAKK